MNLFKESNLNLFKFFIFSFFFVFSLFSLDFFGNFVLIIFRTKTRSKYVGLVLFMNCVRELMLCRKQDFEFSEKLLIFLLDSAFGDRFSTFVFPSEQARLNFTEKNSGLKFPSVWHYALMVAADEFANPDFDEQDQGMGVTVYCESLALSFFRYKDHTPFSFFGLCVTLTLLLVEEVMLITEDDISPQIWYTYLLRYNPEVEQSFESLARAIVSLPQDATTMKIVRSSIFEKY